LSQEAPPSATVIAITMEEGTEAVAIAVVAIEPVVVIPDFK
jgi:hypothetical protein